MKKKCVSGEDERNKINCWNILNAIFTSLGDNDDYYGDDDDDGNDNLCVLYTQEAKLMIII